MNKPQWSPDHSPEERAAYLLAVKPKTAKRHAMAMTLLRVRPREGREFWHAVVAALDVARGPGMRVERRYSTFGPVMPAKNGRSWRNVTCAFCGAVVKVYVWSLAGRGKRCPGCGALHTSAYTAKTILDSPGQVP